MKSRFHHDGAPDSELPELDAQPASARPSAFRRWARFLVPPAIVAAALVIAAALAKPPEPPAAAPTAAAIERVEVVPATPRRLRAAVSSYGTVEPALEASLTARLAGEVVEISRRLEVGSEFTRGHVLVHLDDRDARLAVRRLEAAVRSAEMRLVEEQAEAEVAFEQWQASGLGDASPLALRQPQLALAEAELDAARAELDKALLDVERTRIRAPFDGRVLRRHVELGDYVGVGQVLAEVFATEELEVRLPIPPAAVRWLGLERVEGAAMLVDPLGGDARWARFERVEGVIEEATRQTFAVCRLRSDGAAELPEIGSFHRATLVGRWVEDHLVVPRHAIGDNSVHVLDHEDRLQRRGVEVAWQDGDLAWLSGGWRAGDRIVTSPIDTPTPGRRFEALEVDAPQPPQPSPPAEAAAEPLPAGPLQAGPLPAGPLQAGPAVLAATVSTIYLRAASLQATDGGGVIRLELSARPENKSFTLADGRWVLDLASTVLEGMARSFELADGSTVRLAQFRSSPPVTRLVVDGGKGRFVGLEWRPPALYLEFGAPAGSDETPAP